MQTIKYLQIMSAETLITNGKDIVTRGGLMLTEIISEN